MLTGKVLNNFFFDLFIKIFLEYSNNAALSAIKKASEQAAISTLNYHKRSNRENLNIVIKEKNQQEKPKEIISSMKPQNILNRIIKKSEVNSTKT